MIVHVWTVLCSRSIIDDKSNNISLIDVLEQLAIIGFLPTVVPITFEVVNLWARSDVDQPSRGQARLRFLDPSGHIRGEHEYEVDLSAHQRSRTGIAIAGLPVQEAGHHHFLVQLWDEGEAEWRDVVRIPLEILFEPSERQDTEG